MRKSYTSRGQSICKHNGDKKWLNLRGVVGQYDQKEDNIAKDENGTRL